MLNTRVNIDNNSIPAIVNGLVLFLIVYVVVRVWYNPALIIKYGIILNIIPSRPSVPTFVELTGARNIKVLSDEVFHLRYL